LGVGALTAATLQLRSLLSAQAMAAGRSPRPGLWDWDDEPLGFEATTAPSTTLATVLPWPSHRRPPTFFDDPDLPGGA
ncbi:MAG TPA: hypothetical protein VG411_20650, partial [Actinomycetota bacterium]|nr:hypothetical protein [Actinomycetota bacterium]